MTDNSNNPTSGYASGLKADETGLLKGLVFEVPTNLSSFLDAVREGQHPELLELIFSGPELKIPAIKLVRDATSCDLAEAKCFVEGLADTLKVRCPERFRKPPPLSERKAMWIGAFVFVVFAFGIFWVIRWLVLRSMNNG